MSSQPTGSTEAAPLEADQEGVERKVEHEQETHRELSVFDALGKVPEKISEVLEDVLGIACGGASGSGGNAGANSNSGVVNKISIVAGVSIMKNRWSQRGCRSPLSSVNTTDSADSTSTTSSEEFNVTKEQNAMQLSGESGFTESFHQSRSHPDGSGTDSKLLTRNSSVSSQDFPDTGTGTPLNRSSSPQIRAYAPDGRHYPHQHEALQAASSYPPRSSRSPSPARATSLDARFGSPASYSGNLNSSGTSPSQNTLSSINSRPNIRCLTPLPIPPSRSASSDGGTAPPASPLGTIQPDLYTKKDAPLHLRTRRSEKSLGQMHLCLKYDFDKSDLIVKLIEAHLASSDEGGFYNPYIKLSLFPEVDARKRQTKQCNNTNPMFNEEFKFPVSHEELQEKVLILQVFDFDRFSRNDNVGSVRISMNELELGSSMSSIEIYGDIERERKPPEEKQEILLSLSYLPSAERLTLVVIQARNLFLLQGKEKMNPAVKIYLICGEKKRREKRKTTVAKDTRCPTWNESFSFEKIPQSMLTNSAIEVCVVDNDMAVGVDNDDVIGSCIIGPGILYSKNPESMYNESGDHWLLMMRNMRKTITMWHTLH